MLKNERINKKIKNIKKLPTIFLQKDNYSVLTPTEK